MICAELERLEGQLDDIITELEKPYLTEKERKTLEAAYARLSRTIDTHQKTGHEGGPCYEE